MKSKTLIQIYRFFLVGILNTAIDLAVLNVLIFITSRGRSGFYYAFFKSISFCAALLNSYVMNKKWTFSAQQSEKNKKVEFGQFLLISILGLVINVGAATIFVNYISAPISLANIWPSVAALSGTILGLFWNFAGYKLIVFKGHHELLPPA